MKTALVQVFNRWGGLVFESKGGDSYTILGMGQMKVKN